MCKWVKVGRFLIILISFSRPTEIQSVDEKLLVCAGLKSILRTSPQGPIAVMSTFDFIQWNLPNLVLIIMLCWVNLMEQITPVDWCQGYLICDTYKYLIIKCSYFLGLTGCINMLITTKKERMKINIEFSTFYLTWRFSGSRFIFISHSSVDLWLCFIGSQVGYNNQVYIGILTRVVFFTHNYFDLYFFFLQFFCPFFCGYVNKFILPYPYRCDFFFFRMIRDIKMKENAV